MQTQFSFESSAVRCFHQVFCVGRSVGCSSPLPVLCVPPLESLRQRCFPPPGGPLPTNVLPLPPTSHANTVESNLTGDDNLNMKWIHEENVEAAWTECSRQSCFPPPGGCGLLCVGETYDRTLPRSLQPTPAQDAPLCSLHQGPSDRLKTHTKHKTTCLINKQINRITNKLTKDFKVKTCDLRFPKKLHWAFACNPVTPDNSFGQNLKKRGE